MTVDEEPLDARHARLARMPTYALIRGGVDGIYQSTRVLVPDITIAEARHVHVCAGGDPVLLQTAGLIVLIMRDATTDELRALRERVRAMRRDERILCGLEHVSDEPIEEDEDDDT